MTRSCPCAIGSARRELRIRVDIADLEFMVTQRFYTPRELADMLRVNVKTVWRMCREGEIPYSRFGRQIRFSEEDVATILENARSHMA